MNRTIVARYWYVASKPDAVSARYVASESN